MQVNRAAGAGNAYFAFFSVSAFSNALCQFAKTRFLLLQNAFMVGYGIKEFFLDRRAAKNLPCRGSIEKIEQLRKHFLSIHGLTYIAVGVLGALEAMDQYAWLSLGQALPAITFGSAGLFLYGCLYALEYYTKIYKEAVALEKSAGHEKQARALKISSTLGILNSLGYLASIFFALYPPTQAIALLLATFSIFVGTVNFLIASKSS